MSVRDWLLSVACRGRDGGMALRTELPDIMDGRVTRAARGRELDRNRQNSRLTPKESTRHARVRGQSL